MKRLSIGVVNAIDGKIGLVLGPFPVVLVSAEGRNLHWRGAHKTDVRVLGVEAHVVLLSGPHALKARLKAGFLRILLLQDGTYPAVAERLPGGLQLFLQGIDLFRYVKDAPKEVELLPRHGDFFGTGKGEEAGFQVVALRGGEGNHV